MGKITRRELLRKLSALPALGALGSLDALMLSVSRAEASTENYRALVCIFLFGGNDANNTVVPLGNGYAAYSAIRKSLAIPAPDLIPLMLAGQGAYGLHPELLPLKDLWDSGKIGVLFNVGPLAEPITKAAYNENRARKPDGLFSHSDQQMLWQGAGGSSILRNGWGGRMADRLSGMNSGAALPMAISVNGDNIYVTGNITSGIAISPDDGFNIKGSDNSTSAVARRSALFQLLDVDQEALIVRSAGNTMKSAIIGSDVAAPLIASDSSTVTNFFTGQNNGLARQLLLVAKLIEARATLGAKRQIFFVSLDGFDTHDSQLNRQSQLFAQLAPALRSFYEATVQLGVASNVATFTLSDFGRTLRPNTNGGTDHGWGSHHFVIGGAVRGRQFYGQYPILALDGPDDASEEGRWIPTISVDQYAATLASWFGVSSSDLSTVVPNIGRFPISNLGFMA